MTIAVEQQAKMMEETALRLDQTRGATQTLHLVAGSVELLRTKFQKD
jgi:hypothetical protein